MNIRCMPIDNIHKYSVYIVADIVHLTVVYMRVTLVS